jgi:hypothetical protein
MKNLSKYLEDKRFIDWVFNPTEELEIWWSSYKSSHKEERENILLARRIICKFKTSDKELSVEEKIILFSNILKQIENKKERQKKIKLYFSWMKYAAVAVLFFSFGALLFYRQDNFNKQLFTSQVVEPFTGDGARLVRPNGENIILDEKKSVVEYRSDGKIIVNNNIIESGQPENKNATAPQLNQLIIPYGKTSDILLPDGSKVQLNAGSRLVYPEVFKDKAREVLLVGEAFFDVVHDAEHPFVVQTTGIRVQVLGTRFNVSAYPADKTIETVLTEGKVRLEKNNAGIFSESIELKPNELASFNKSTRETLVSEVDPENYILWKNGLFKFESTDLSRVVKKLERYYNIHFHYKDPVLGTIRISGKLELGENCDEIVNRIAIAASVNMIKKGENYYEIEK